MRKEKETGLFRRIGAAFTRNFGLKLLSLALAVLIYVVLRPEAHPHAQSSVLPVPSVLPGPAAAPKPEAAQTGERPPAAPARQEARPEETPKPPARKTQSPNQAQATDDGAKKAPAAPKRPKNTQ